MAPEIIDVEQGSPEWFAARAGLPTASRFKDILAKGEGKMRRGYMLKLAGELLTGEPMDNYTNENMERGHLLEDEARRLYAFVSDDPLTRVGFVRNGQKGASPDSFIGERGVLEIKTAFPHILIDKLLRDEFPPEHKPQCQGQLWVSEREFVDVAIYWPKLPLFKKRAYRDAGYISKLAQEVDAFNEELAETVERIRSYAGDSHGDLKRALARSAVVEAAHA